ncbi:MAG: hypothetical protein M1820_003434 [Bogoriella megaspora]|nr:MAG: hypothetical protein M1820_003434 [Bogoriella megaspora]
MEVLVHIGAPSGRNDDERYQAEARNYAEFETSSRLVLRPSVSRHSESPFKAVEEQSQKIPLTIQESGLDFIEDSQEATAVLDSQLSSSSLRALLNDSTSHAWISEVADQRAAATFDADVPPSADIASQTTDIAKPSSFPRTISPDHTKARSEYMTIKEGRSLGIAFIGRTDSTSLVSRARQSQSLRTATDSLNMAQRTQASYPSYSSAESPKIIRKNGSVGGPRTSNLSKSIQNDCTEKLVPQGSSRTAMTYTKQRPSHLEKQHAINFQDYPYEIFVRDPPIGIERSIPSQLNEEASTLRHLIQHPELQGRYKPVEKGRVLHECERGKWVVDSSRWSPEIQLGFWLWLRLHTESGRLGWSITLFREHAKGICDELRHSSLGVVTVFCREEVQEHIYLALYVASNGKMVGTSAEFRSAVNDDLIVRMR